MIFNFLNSFKLSLCITLLIFLLQFTLSLNSNKQYFRKSSVYVLQIEQKIKVSNSYSHICAIDTFFSSGLTNYSELKDPYFMNLSSIVIKL